MTTELTPETRQKIFDELIEPIYYSDIRSCLSQRKYWKLCYHVCSGASRLCAGVSTVFSFATSLFRDKSMISFTAGSLNVIAIVFHQMSSYSLKEYRIHSHELTSILRQIHIRSLPDMMASDDMNSETNP